MMIEEMKKRAKKVAAEHAAHEAAKGTKREAQVEFLRAVLIAVWPALPALCSRIAGLPGPTFRAFNVGHCLYLSEKGQWVESCEGGALLLTRTDAFVVEHFCAEDIADVLSLALTKHAGSRDGSTTEIRKEAERLRAATLLLKS